MEISNKTKLPLRVPLPGGKTLHLSPGKTGQISSKAADYAPLKKMIEAEKLEIIDAGHSKGTGGSKNTGLNSSQGGGSGGGVRHTGDR